MGLALHLRDEATQATILIGSGRALGKSPTATVPESKKSNSSRIKINLLHRTNRATEKKSRSAFRNIQIQQLQHTFER
jgi:hypothetical protein